MRPETPSQTAGPYVHIGCTPGLAGVREGADLGSRMINGPVEGQRITFTGRVHDGAGAALTDSVVEIWQADAQGRFSGADAPGFSGWGRSPCDPESGVFTFETVKPGRTRLGNGTLQAPHVTLWIVARGINLGLHTRAYFADAAEANAADPVLSSLPPARIQTLLARPSGSGYHHEIHLQGPDETIFFDV
ncbi:MAG: protocatechuate 3,4-dioxygenase subunit alpha [Pseudomonadota bacterium]